MKILLVLLLGLCTVLSANADEQPCAVDTCTCDLTKYTAALTPPKPSVTCPNGQMIIYMPKCQLIKNLFDPANLTLQVDNSPDCESKEYLVNGEATIGFHNPLTSTKCGNTVSVNSSHVTYSNNLYIYPEKSTIISRNTYNESLSCVYPLRYPVQLDITLKPLVKIVPLTIPGVDGEVDITMSAYLESTFTTLVTEDTVLYVEDTIYIQVFMPNIEAGTFSIKVLRLYATPGGATPANGLVFNLTSGSDGCPDPEYGAQITIIENGDSSISRFALKLFQITNQDFVDLFADVTICPTACPSNCKQRSGESSQPDNVATMNLQLSVGGGIYSGASDRLSLSWTLVSLISALLLVKLM